MYNPRCPEKGGKNPHTRISDDCETPRGCWELIPASQQEHVSIPIKYIYFLKKIKLPEVWVIKGGGKATPSVNTSE